jgi:hypothetical protein
MRRHDIMGHAQDKTVTFEPLQRLGEHAFADPADAAAEFAEPEGAAFEDDEDKDAPAAGHMFENLA